MSNNQNTLILLVESNPEEKENFSSLAAKENWTVLELGSSYEAIQWLKKNNEASLAVIAEDAVPLNAYQAFDYIRKEIKSNLPVVISKRTAADNNDGYIYIEKPFTTSILKTLKKALHPHSDETAEKVYSLEYLETISGGNHEFLIDCLQTFISSVSGKMEELKEAVKSNNNESIGAIAHNIKPSFEMLESSIGKDICNKLTYEADTSDIPVLAEELNNEFKTIETALKEDFNELR